MTRRTKKTSDAQKNQEKKAILGELESIKSLLDEDSALNIPVLTNDGCEPVDDLNPSHAIDQTIPLLTENEPETTPDHRNLPKVDEISHAIVDTEDDLPEFTLEKTLDESPSSAPKEINTEDIALTPENLQGQQSLFTDTPTAEQDAPKIEVAAPPHNRSTF